MAHDPHQQNQSYPELLSTNTQLMHSFETANQELYNIQTGIEMLGIPSSKSQANPVPDAWREFFQKSGNSSAAAGSANLIPPEQRQMLVDESSFRCLFPANEQANNQGLSLSLLQNSRNPHQGGVYYTSPPVASLYQQPHQLKDSRYLIPAQELLNEFCSLAGEITSTFSRKQTKSKQWEESGGASSSNSWNNRQSLQSLDILELQKIKARLYAMLEEVDRRYRRYCEQMKVVVSSFEAVAGERSAVVYTALASKTMSRHFRCLRDGIVGQINAVKKALGEKDPVGPGVSRGETPRLKLLDQCLRQQKAMQQAGMLESHPWRPQRGLPERSVSILRAWLFEHFLHPYPSDVDKHILARQTGLSRSQVSNWFINARVRLWKPMVEEMYMEEMKEQDGTALDSSTNQFGQNPNPNPNSSREIGSSSSELLAPEQKPNLAQLLHDSGSLSSIFNSGRHREGGGTDNDVRQQQNFGIIDMDNFNSYNRQNYGSSSVSLTLGLQQHDRGAMNLSFSLASQNSLLYSGEPIEEVQPGQFSIVDGEGQSLHYRNLVGTQLLHDLTG